MRRATKIIAASFGLFAGFGGLEHGYFEILQGNARPQSMMIASIVAPCVPEEVWHLCEPAMTILPNFLMTGILSMLLGLATMIWAGAFFAATPGRCSPYASVNRPAPFRRRNFPAIDRCSGRCCWNQNQYAAKKGVRRILASAGKGLAVDNYPSFRRTVRAIRDRLFLQRFSDGVWGVSSFSPRASSDFDSNRVRT